MNKATISLCGVRFAYADSTWCLSIPGLELGRERVTCIVGPNGSGKSTLLRVAAGILPPMEGLVYLDDFPLRSMPRRRIAKRISFLPQESAPLFDYPAEMVVRMGRYAYVNGWGALSAEDAAAVDHALRAVAVDALRKRLLSRLSGGERRRVLIASVLAQEPDVLLLDEPTASLDIHHAAAVMRLLSGFGTGGPSVVLVTHDINMAALFGDRILLLAEGRICADGTPSDVVRADVMKQVYGEDVLMMDHPETQGPMIVARRSNVKDGRA